MKIRLDIGGLLLIVFITLKLCGVINWSWIWVIAPFWIPAAITALILLFVGVLVLCGAKVRRK